MKLGYATLDVDRRARTGDAEVVFGHGKTPEQVVGALRGLHAANPDGPVLATRVDEAGREHCRRNLPRAVIDDIGRTVVLGPPRPSRGRVAVVSAGTCDLPVVRECATTIAVFGSAADQIVDVGVAGIHRLFDQLDRIKAADVVVVVAGMEAALPSVVGGLIGTPIVAVPTSVGYGWHLEGVTAWLAMVNTCAPGITTVNVDNGFGAGVAAARIARATARAAA